MLSPLLYRNVYGKYTMNIRKMQPKFQGVRTMGGKLSRTKGHSYERNIARELSVVFGKVLRQLEYQKDDCRGVDLKGTGNLAVQCKRGKKYSPISKLFNSIWLD